MPTYFMKVTAAGAAKIAAADAGGPAVALTQMAVGDGAGTDVTPPTGTETVLVNERWRGALSQLTVSGLDPTVMIAEGIVPTDVGGWSVREFGIYDSAGTLFAYGNFPATYKSIAAEGATRELRIRGLVRLASTANVTIVVDASLLYVTQDWANGRFCAKTANLSDLASTATARTNLGLGTSATLAVDTDGTLAANSDTRVPSQKATKTAIAALLDTDTTFAANSNAKAPSQAAVKAYVDNVAAGLDPKASVKAATTANIALSGAQTVDGVALVAGDRALVKNQTTPAQNGIYVVAAGAWARSADMDSWGEVPGANVWVEQGTANGDRAFVCTADQGGTLGTTAITWTLFGGTGVYAGLGANTFTGLQSFAASAAGGASVNFAPGVAPTAPNNGDCWVTGTVAQIRIGGSTKTIATLEGGTYTGKVIFAPSAAGGAGLNIVPGVAPTSPNPGDFWSIAGSGFFGCLSAGVIVSFVDSGTAQTLSNKRMKKRISQYPSVAMTPNSDTDDICRGPLASAPSLTINNPAGTPDNGDQLIFEFNPVTNNTLIWGSKYLSTTGGTLPTNVVAGKTCYVFFIYNSNTTSWLCHGVYAIP